MAWKDILCFPFSIFGLYKPTPLTTSLEEDVPGTTLELRKKNKELAEAQKNANEWKQKYQIALQAYGTVKSKTNLTHAKFCKNQRDIWCNRVNEIYNQANALQTLDMQQYTMESNMRTIETIETGTKAVLHHQTKLDGRRVHNIAEQQKVIEQNTNRFTQSFNKGFGELCDDISDGELEEELRNNELELNVISNGPISAEEIEQKLLEFPDKPQTQPQPSKKIPHTLSQKIKLPA
jgi:hypothetical protein